MSNMQTINEALKKTREVLDDPDSVIDERRLPKAGNDPLEFEDEEYAKSREEAKARV